MEPIRAWSQSKIPKRLMASHLPAQTLNLAHRLVFINLLTEGFLALACNDIQTPVCFFLQISSSAHRLEQPFLSSLQRLCFQRGLIPQQPQLQRSIFLSTPPPTFFFKSMQMMDNIGPLWFENTRARTRTHTRYLTKPVREFHNRGKYWEGFI